MSDSIEEMIDDGSIIFDGVSDDGEALYIFTERCRELHPEVWKQKYQEFLEDISELYLLGFVDIEVGESEDSDNVIVNEKTYVDDPEMPKHLIPALEAVRAAAKEEYGLEKDG